jgi:hypothetical protein
LSPYKKPFEYNASLLGLTLKSSDLNRGRPAGGEIDRWAYTGNFDTCALAGNPNADIIRIRRNKRSQQSNFEIIFQ